MKKILCAFAALMILLSAAACGMSESLFVDNRETDKIYPERLNLRAQPSTDAAVIGVLSGGAKVIVMDEANGWAHVRATAGEGYVSAQYIKAAGSAR